MNEEVAKGKTAAIVAYLTIVGSLIAITMNLEPKNAFARFHIRQAFGIHLIFHGFAIFFSSSDFAYAWIGLYLFFFILWLYGFLAALNEKKTSVPILGPYFQKWFTFIQ